MFRTLAAIIAVISILLSNGCDKDNPMNSSSIGFTINHFPLQVGANWEYSILDSMIDCTQFDCLDSASISIIDSLTDSNKIVHQNWHFEKSNQDVLVTQQFDSNNLTIYWEHELMMNLEFPLEVGKYWVRHPIGFGMYDSTEVVDKRNVVTPAGEFKNTFFIVGVTTGFEFFATYHAWIVPHIGIVKIDYSMFTIGYESKKSWTLKKYNESSPFNHFTVNQFPNFDGLSWRYEIYNFINMHFDTVVVTVAESSTVATWTYDFTDSIKQEIVSIEYDSIFISKGFGAQYNRKLQFPFMVGNDWINSDFSRTSITGIYNYYITDNYYFPTYSLQTRYDCGDECSHTLAEYYTPHVGLLYKREYQSDFDYNLQEFVDVKNLYWRLLDYNFDFSSPGFYHIEL